jgi:IS605 OrfB family transposase
MRLTTQLKLLPTPEQADSLKRTLERANAACDYISQVAWDTQTFRQFPIHRLTYQDVRETFGLAAQLTVRCIAKVADAYKLDRNLKRTFAPLGAVAYDERILSYTHQNTAVTIWTLNGRQEIPFVCGDRQRALLAFRRGETDLAFVRGDWYLFATADIETPEPIDVQGVLGIDLGVTNIAVDSDGDIYSGRTIKNVRYRHRTLRRRLQHKRTLGSRRRLRKLAGQEYRFATWVNHTLSKRMVAKAECTKRAIAVENLTHIRTRIKARKPQRVTLHSWSFAQLQAFIAYKALGAGVPVHRVNPRNTSRTCPRCKRIAKANRKTQASFLCTRCGLAGHADVIAAENIRVLGGALVTAPYCSDVGTALPIAPEQSPIL